MSLNQLINPIQGLSLKCENLECKEDLGVENTLNVNNLNNSSYGYSDATSRYSKNSSDTSIFGFTESRLLVERKFLAHRNSPEQFEPVNYIHYKGTVGISTNPTPSQSVIIDLDVSQDGVSNRTDASGNTAISYSGRGLQIFPTGTQKLQLSTTTSIDVVNGKVKLTFFNPQGVSLLASTAYELDFDICIEKL